MVLPYPIGYESRPPKPKAIGREEVLAGTSDQAAANPYHPDPPSLRRAKYPCRQRAGFGIKHFNYWSPVNAFNELNPFFIGQGGGGHDTSSVQLDTFAGDYTAQYTLTQRLHTSPPSICGPSSQADGSVPKIDFGNGPNPAPRRPNGESSNREFAVFQCGTQPNFTSTVSRDEVLKVAQPSRKFFAVIGFQYGAIGLAISSTHTAPTEDLRGRNPVAPESAMYIE
ncbi:hypothetical protein FQR65_LT20484 [Abscondita terminalis]|nr:hypothetical protein FQR65_LT20484 [Abscondita terminalis]